MSSCNKDRIIDSIYFGLFFRKDIQIQEATVEKKNNLQGFYNDVKRINNFLEFKNISN